MELIKYNSVIDLFPKGAYTLYKIEPLKGNITLNITTTASREGDKITIFMSNLGSEKKVSFDAGFDVKEMPVDRSGYLELLFNGENFVSAFIGNLKGERGEVGPRGPQGERGELGPIGPQGLNGSSGTSGISIEGPQGQPGLNGSSGSSGISIPGPKGERGEDGLNGINGRSCTCEHCLNER